MLHDQPAVFCLEESGLETAERVRKLVGGCLVVRQHLQASQPATGVTDFPGAMREFFAAGNPIIGVCAAGIVIRILAPLILAKQIDPPVLAVAEDASVIVPLLGGHRGANSLAAKVARGLSSHAAITTAGDLKLKVALDDPPAGWRLDAPQGTKATVAALLSGIPATISGTADWISPLRSLPNINVDDEPPNHKSIVLQAEGLDKITYWRADLALGVGCSRRCPPRDLIGLVETTLETHEISPFQVHGVYSIDMKSDEAAVHRLAEEIGVPARFFHASQLREMESRLAKPSQIVFDKTGTYGVCEGAALAGAGDGGHLVIAKQKSENATCAIARYGDTPVYRGLQRGRLAIVGIGPGTADLRTREASCMISIADEVVGYQLYVDLLGPLIQKKPVKKFAIGKEEERCRYALEEAGKGKNVALVCSGDSGIYAMAALALELVERNPDDGGVSAEAQRAEIVCIPGVTAMQVASSRVGALLGHDFCAISLSDLLTPREDILKRIQAAGEGDFVVAFYNPVSRKRQDLLVEAREILLKHRPLNTPVLLARNLGREDERLMHRTLSMLSPSEIDMMTIVLVGSSNSRAFRSGDAAAGADGWLLYTPRGYGMRPKGEINR